MTDLEQIELDAILIEQIVQSPAWEAITRRLTIGIEEFIERLLVSNITQDQAQAFRQRVLAYRELLDLPALIRQQAKDASATVGESDTTTEDE